MVMRGEQTLTATTVTNLFHFPINKQGPRLVVN